MHPMQIGNRIGVSRDRVLGKVVPTRYTKIGAYVRLRLFQGNLD